MSEENTKQNSNNKESNADFSMSSPNKEFKSMINKNLSINRSQAQIPESFVRDKQPTTVDTTRGADSPEKIPNDQD